MTRWILPVLPLAALMACGPRELETDPPRITVSALEEARTHQRYTAWLTAKAGTPPLSWEVAGDLPPGLALNPAGAITGTPTEKGTASLTLTVTDADGRTDSADVDLEVKWSKGVVACGESRSGSFGDGAHLGYNNIDWDTKQGWTVLEIPLPPEEITSVHLELGGGSFFPVYLALPGTPEGDQDLERNHRLFYSYPGYPVTIDLGTYPDLPSYRAYGEPIQLIVATDVPTDWEATTTCTTGPVIQSVTQDPARLGEPLTVNYSIYGEQGSVTWTLSGALPPWASFDPASARITGIAEETGTWEYTLVATDEAGDTDMLNSGFGVYEHTPVACNERVEWTPTEGFYEGSAYAQADPEGYRVFELALPPEVSAVYARYDSPDGGYLSLITPGDPTFVTFGQEGDFNPGSFSLTADVPSVPSVLDYQDAGLVHAVAYDNYASDGTAAFEFACTIAPQVALAALPVLEEGGAAAHPLPVVGGTPPYTLGAVGLPAGITLDPTGLLQATAPAPGAHPVTVTVSDSTGDETVKDWTLFVGDDAACQGATPLACGAVLTDVELAANARFDYCLSPRLAEENALVSLVVSLKTGGALDGFVVDPGGAPGDPGTWILAPRGPSSSGRVLDEIRQPLLSRFTDLPVFLGLETTTGAVYDLAVDCTP